MAKKTKNPVGRPLKFKSVAALSRAINKYFAECDPHLVEVQVVKTLKDGTQKVVKEKVMSAQVPYTITGLALALDTSRIVLLDYESKDEYSNTIKRAKRRCESFAEKRLFEGHATGPIFNLKNNYRGWKEEKEVNLKGELGVLLRQIGDNKEPPIGKNNTNNDEGRVEKKSSKSKVASKQSVLD